MIRSAHKDDAGAARAGVVALIVLVAVLAGGVFVWVRYTRSPQYAALQAVHALSARDYPAFAQWVDVDAVVRQAVRAEAASRLGGAQLPPGVEENAVASAKSEVSARVSEGVPGVPANVPFLALVLGTPVRVSGNDGSRAQATVSAGGRSIGLVLRHDPDHWRVAEVADAARLLGQGTSRAPGVGPPLWLAAMRPAILPSRDRPRPSPYVRVVEWQTR